MRFTATVAAFRPGILSSYLDEGCNPIIGSFALKRGMLCQCAEPSLLYPLHLPASRFQILPILVRQPERSAAIVAAVFESDHIDYLWFRGTMMEYLVASSCKRFFSSCTSIGILKRSVMIRLLTGGRGGSSCIGLGMCRHGVMT